MNALPAAVPNPHLLGALQQASGSVEIVASEDIYDVGGAKLWSRHQPVPESLRQRLLQRRLRRPIESCLEVRDGVTNVHLVEAMEAMLATPGPVDALVRPWATELLHELRSLPLHATAQLLLTLKEANRQAVFRHAVTGMAVCGALAQSASMNPVNVRIAMLGGLLHDIGEIYLDPAYLDAPGSLDAAGFRHVVTHPLIGAELLETLTDYPVVLARGLREHHERLDGTGYPRGAALGAPSGLGQMLSVVEVLLGLVGAGPAPLARASLALRLVPGEFPARWAGAVAAAARAAGEDVDAAVAAEGAGGDAAAVEAEIARRLAQLEAALPLAEAAMAAVPPSRPAHAVASLLHRRVERLIVAERAAGLWSAPMLDDAYAQRGHERFERLAALKELRFRIEGLRREGLWAHAPLPEPDEALLAPLWQALAP